MSGERNERKVDIGKQRYTRVLSMDSPGPGGAYHVYHVESVPKSDSEPVAVFATVQFQNGGVAESGVNGCHNEDLIAIVIDRLQEFQNGNFACDANSDAIDALRTALAHLWGRTEERQSRGVEGKLIP